jgi:hypothetical protein
MISYFVVFKNIVLVHQFPKPFVVMDSHIIYISYLEDLFFKYTPFLSMFVGMSVVYLFAYQIKNMEKNLTTVEHYIIKDRDFSPFDTGSIR